MHEGLFVNMLNLKIFDNLLSQIQLYEQHNESNSKELGFLLLELKKINRSYQIKCKNVKDITLELRLKVDQKFLNLQNALYRLNYLKQEIDHCVTCPSLYEEIDFISWESFIAEQHDNNFHNCESNVISTIILEKNYVELQHKVILQRLQWEVEERKRLTTIIQNLSAKKVYLQNQFIEKSNLLDSLYPMLELTLKSTGSIQKIFDIDIEKVRQDILLIKSLPCKLAIMCKAFEILKKSATIIDFTLMNIEGLNDANHVNLILSSLKDVIYPNSSIRKVYETNKMNVSPTTEDFSPKQEPADDIDLSSKRHSRRFNDVDDINEQPQANDALTINDILRPFSRMINVRLSTTIPNKVEQIAEILLQIVYYPNWADGILTAKIREIKFDPLPNSAMQKYLSSRPDQVSQFDSYWTMCKSNLAFDTPDFIFTQSSEANINNALSEINNRIHNMLINNFGENIVRTIILPAALDQFITSHNGVPLNIAENATLESLHLYLGSLLENICQCIRSRTKLYYSLCHLKMTTQTYEDMCAKLCQPPSNTNVIVSDASSQRRNLYFDLEIQEGPPFSNIYIILTYTVEFDSIIVKLRFELPNNTDKLTTVDHILISNMSKQLNIKIELEDKVNRDNRSNTILAQKITEYINELYLKDQAVPLNNEEPLTLYFTHILDGLLSIFELNFTDADNSINQMEEE